MTLFDTPTPETPPKGRTGHAGLDAVDLAKTDPCPGCGAPVRRFASVPVAGTSLDPIYAGPWHCSDCLRAKLDAKIAGTV